MYPSGVKVGDGCHSYLMFIILDVGAIVLRHV